MVIENKFHYFLIKIHLIGFSYDNTKNIFLKKINMIPNGLNNIFDSLLGSTPKEFFSEQFYDNLYNDEGIEAYYQDCSSLDTISDRFKRNSLKTLCARLVKYLKNEYITLDKKTFAYDECILLNYWVYNRLVSIYNSDDYSIILTPFVLLQRIWHDIVDKPPYKPRNNICVPDGGILTQKDWRNRKELYDYCVNYDTIEKELKYYSYMCPKYWNYVENHTSVFKYFKTLCYEKKNQCPGFYEGCKKYDPIDVLKSFDCNEQMAKQKAEVTSKKDKLQLQGDRSADHEQISQIPGDSHLTRNGDHPATKTGDILLGVVATSLTSGALYRVNINI
ncbi:hypothetical protein PVNG_04741 [Plasmodium vivax North Korean]|uniref:Variable surface protein Vir4 n=1 Tax=Plasmodium vivax North Korean TaxID=1035514 RepID=A0A0J9U110_PLAVI|nr:hypothetical protein PVNG_04741 [Plasmodium vivax North Korean]